MLDDQTRNAIEQTVKHQNDYEQALIAEEAEKPAKVKRHRNRPDLQHYGYENAQPGDNARYLKNALVSLDLPPIDVSDPKQVENRIKQYFDWCIQNDEKPKVTGMANWIGVHRDTINTWLRGEVRGKTHADIIKKFYGIMEELWENYMLEGTVNTVSGIFLGKVMFGYRETSEVVLTPNTPLQNIDTDESRKRLTSAIPDDE